MKKKIIDNSLSNSFLNKQMNFKEQESINVSVFDSNYLSGDPDGKSLIDSSTIFSENLDSLSLFRVINTFNKLIKDYGHDLECPSLSKSMTVSLMIEILEDQQVTLVSLFESLKSGNQNYFTPLKVKSAKGATVTDSSDARETELCKEFLEKINELRTKREKMQSKLQAIREQIDELCLSKDKESEKIPITYTNAFY